VFLPYISVRYPIIAIIAGQEAPVPPPSRRGYHHFPLTGVTVDWFFRYAESYGIDMQPEHINLLHEGYPF
jgi:hypothetical protein